MCRTTIFLLYDHIFSWQVLEGVFPPAAMLRRDHDAHAFDRSSVDRSASRLLE
jgi:hypothetical protein